MTEHLGQSETSALKGNLWVWTTEGKLVFSMVLTADECQSAVSAVEALRREPPSRGQSEC